MPRLKPKKVQGRYLLDHKAADVQDQILDTEYNIQKIVELEIEIETMQADLDASYFIIDEQDDKILKLSAVGEELSSLKYRFGQLVLQNQDLDNKLEHSVTLEINLRDCITVMEKKLELVPDRESLLDRIAKLEDLHSKCTEQIASLHLEVQHLNDVTDLLRSQVEDETAQLDILLPKNGRQRNVDGYCPKYQKSVYREFERAKKAITLLHLGREEPAAESNDIWKRLCQDYAVAIQNLQKNTQQNVSSRIQLLSLAHNLSLKEYALIGCPVGKNLYRKIQIHVMENGVGAPVPKEERRRGEEIKINSVRDLTLYVAQNSEVRDGSRQVGGKEIPRLVRYKSTEVLVEEFCKMKEAEGEGSFRRSDMLKVVRATSTMGSNLTAADTGTVQGIANLGALRAKIIALRDENGKAGKDCDRELEHKLNELIIEIDFVTRLLKDAPELSKHVGTGDPTGPAAHCIYFAMNCKEKDTTGPSECGHNHTGTCEYCQIVHSLPDKVRFVLEVAALVMPDFTASLQISYNLDLHLLFVAHLIRLTYENKTWEKLLAHIKLHPEHYLILCDWAMKFVPTVHKETQVEYFGKRGMDWHGIVVLYWNQKTGVVEYYTVIHVCAVATEDAFAVATSLGKVISDHKIRFPEHTGYLLLTDGAGCYNGVENVVFSMCAYQIYGVFCVSQHTREAGGGKMCLTDGTFGVLKRKLRAMILRGRGANDVTSPEDLHRVLKDLVDLDPNHIQVDLITLDLRRVDLKIPPQFKKSLQLQCNSSRTFVEGEFKVILRALCGLNTDESEFDFTSLLEGINLKELFPAGSVKRLADDELASVLNTSLTKVFVPIDEVRVLKAEKLDERKRKSEDAATKLSADSEQKRTNSLLNYCGDCKKSFINAGNLKIHLEQGRCTPPSEFGGNTAVQISVGVWKDPERVAWLDVKRVSSHPVFSGGSSSVWKAWGVTDFDLQPGVARHRRARNAPIPVEMLKLVQSLVHRGTAFKSQKMNDAQMVQALKECGTAAASRYGDGTSDDMWLAIFKETEGEPRYLASLVPERYRMKQLISQELQREKRMKVNAMKEGTSRRRKMPRTESDMRDEMVRCMMEMKEIVELLASTMISAVALELAKCVFAKTLSLSQAKQGKILSVLQELGVKQGDCGLLKKKIQVAVQKVGKPAVPSRQAVAVVEMDEDDDDDDAQDSDREELEVGDESDE